MACTLQSLLGHLCERPRHFFPVRKGSTPKRAGSIARRPPSSTTASRRQVSRRTRPPAPPQRSTRHPSPPRWVTGQKRSACIARRWTCGRRLLVPIIHSSRAASMASRTWPRPRAGSMPRGGCTSRYSRCDGVRSGPRTRRSHGRWPALLPSARRPASRPLPCVSLTKPQRCSTSRARAMNPIAIRKRSSSEDCSRRARAGYTRAAPTWRRR